MKSVIKKSLFLLLLCVDVAAFNWNCKEGKEEVVLEILMIFFRKSYGMKWHLVLILIMNYFSLENEMRILCWCEDGMKSFLCFARAQQNMEM
jgi:hypothetical protein